MPVTIVLEPLIWHTMFNVIACEDFKTGRRDIHIREEWRCEKEPQSFFHCGSFDHPDLQLLNDYIFVFWYTN